MPITLDELTYQEAITLIPNREAEWMNLNRKYIVEQDHWQNGAGWSGPTLPANHKAYADFKRHLKRTFVAEDVLNEIVDRHLQAVVGRAPVWYIIPTDDESQESRKSDIKRLTNILEDWLDNRDFMKQVRDATQTLLWAGRSPLRAFIPKHELEANEDDILSVPASNFDRALSRIHITAVDPNQATVTTIDNRPVGIYLYKRDNMNVLEMTYRDDEGRTVIKTVTSAEAQEGVTLDMPHLSITEMNRALVINDAMRRNQMKINHAATGEQTNLAHAGFISRLFLNADMPGKDVEQADGSSKFVPEPFIAGAGITNFVVGATVEDEDGKPKVLTPSYIREEPASPKTFIDTKAATRKYMITRAGQSFIFLNEFSAVSADSRAKARSDFEASLVPTQEQVNRMFEWALNTAIQIAIIISNEERYKDLKVVADTQLDLGIVSPEEQEIAIRLHTGGIISKATAMRMIGIDPNTELELIKQEELLDVPQLPELPKTQDDPADVE